jgi:tetratricopeptide (TPR) repeat protein
MSPRLLAACASLFVLGLGVAAHAQDDGGKKTMQRKKAKAEAAEPAPGELRRDPNGVKGISPMWEAINKGDAAYVARDFAGAIAAYQEAITKAPQNPLAHYRKGQALVGKGDLEEAIKSYTDALRFAQGSSALRAKIMFVIADVRERQKALEDANDNWAKYDAFVAGDPTSKGYSATAKERQKRIADVRRINAEGAEVRARIEKRQAEASKR